VLCRPRVRKPCGALARVSPHAGSQPARFRRRLRPWRRFDVNQAINRESTMPPIESPERDPNAELHGFEPLRAVLAIGALLLGLLLSL